MPDFGLGLTSSILPEDISANFLSKIFGSSFYTVTDFVPTGAVKVIFDLFGAVNTFALVILVMSIAFFTATGVIGTAHEGRVLGGKLHTFWVPVRLIAAAGFLVPVKHGLCLFQVLLLLAVGVSIEFANKLYSIFLNSTYETSFSAPSGIYRGEEANKIAAMILSNMVYMDYMIENYGDVDEETKNSYSSAGQNNWTEAYGQWKEYDGSLRTGAGSKYISYQFNNPRIDSSWIPIDLIDNGHSDLMGSIKFSCNDGAGPQYMQACFEQAQVIDNAITRIKNEVAPAFKAYAEGQVSPLQGSAGASYQDIIRELASELEKKSLLMYESKYTALAEEAKAKFTDYENLGWASAGSIYHTMSMIRARAMDALQAQVDIYNGTHWTEEDYQLNEIKYVTLKKHFLQTLREITPTEYSGDLDTSSLNSILEKAGFRNSILISFIQDFGKGENVGTGNNEMDTNPIDAFATIGHTMLNSVFAAIGIMLGAAILAPAGVVTVMSTAFLMIVGPVFVGGALLAYYVPALPFIIWVSALIGWFIVVIEALVAAPIWVLGISRMDSGEGFFGDKGQQGLFLFFGILVRPFAMLLGFCIAATVIDQVGELLANLFSVYIVDRESITNHSDIPIISGLILFFIFAAIWTSFVHKIFGLVAYLPDVMMQWLGATGHHLGSDKDEQQVSGTVRSAAGHAAISANMSAKGISGGANMKAEKIRNQQAAAEKARNNQDLADKIAASINSTQNRANKGSDTEL